MKVISDWLLKAQKMTKKHDFLTKNGYGENAITCEWNSVLT